MSNIITISREFGSGGRELAKRLSEKLAFKYYDKEIINKMIKQGGFDEKFIDSIMKNGNDDYPYTIGKSFSYYSAVQKQATDMLVLEQKILKELAKNGDCVIVGRGADFILKEFNPLNIFVYSNIESKINRCKQKSLENEGLTEKQITKMIKQIDKARSRFYLLLGGDFWGYKENYHLCINTTNVEIKNIVPSIANFAKSWFGGK